MEFELGHTYSGYKILDVVRRSRSAVQYRVENTLAQRVESMRTLTGAAWTIPDAAERFLREVRIRARLSHPHILTFYTARADRRPDGDDHGVARFALPGRAAATRGAAVAGGNGHRQAGAGRAGLHASADISYIATSLRRTFSLGRRDSASSRIFACAPVDPAHSPDAGAVVGNPTYISPEQVKGERQLDSEAICIRWGGAVRDVDGRPPFESRSQFELMMAHVNQAPTAPSETNAAVPKVLDAVVLRGLAKEPGSGMRRQRNFPRR